MTEVDLQQRTAEEVNAQATRVAGELRAGLLPLVQEVAGSRIRPSRLVEALGVDKSLASRITRSLRTESSLELLHLIPSPTGLGILLNAAEKSAVDDAILSPAREAVEGFQAMIESFPGGRASLDVLLSDNVVGVRRRAERSATQAVHRGMSYVLGFQCDAIASALILQPSSQEGFVDGIEVSLRTGVRRLRPSAPVVLFSVNLHRDETQGPWMEPLDPAADAGDPMSFVLPGFSSPERPAVELHRRGSHVMFALPEEIDSAQRSVTVASAYIIRHGWVTHRLEEKEWESRTYLLHYPCRQLVRDLYVREDLYFGSEPNVRLEFPGPAGVGQGTYRDKLSRMNELDMTVTIENLGAGAHAAAVEGIPGYEPLLLHAFDAAKLDPKRFRGYRVRLMYPVPMIGMGWWIRLPEGP